MKTRMLDDAEILGLSANGKIAWIYEPLLSLGIIRDFLSKRLGRGIIIARGETESTMTDARILEDSGYKWILAYAESQRRGRGRRGRSWESRPGGLWFTLGLRRRPIGLEGLSIAIGVGLASLLKELYGIEVGLKWPNDLVLRGLKLAGILVETSITGEDAAVYVGVGINVSNPLPRELADMAIRLEDVVGPVARGTLLALAVKRIVDYVELWMKDSSRVVEEYRAFDLLAGKKVVVESGRLFLRGTVLGVTEKGSLLLRETGSGRITEIVDGEILWAEGIKYKPYT